jgi:hypothetical protein
MVDSLSGAARSTPAAPLLRRGLLILLCGWLCAIAPLAFALEAQAALPRLSQYGGPAWLLFACRAAIVVLGFVAGRLVWRGEPVGLRAAAAWALLTAIATLATAATPYFPANRPPSLKRLVIATTTALHVAVALVLALLARRHR